MSIYRGILTSGLSVRVDFLLLFLLDCLPRNFLADVPDLPDLADFFLFLFRFHFRQMNLSTMLDLRWSFLSYMHAFLAVPSAHAQSVSSVFVLELVGPQHLYFSLHAFSPCLNFFILSILLKYHPRLEKICIFLNSVRSKWKYVSCLIWVS